MDQHPVVQHHTTIESPAQPDNKTTLMRQVVRNLRGLSLKDIQLVVVLTHRLKEQQSSERQAQIARIREEGLRQCALLEGVPREEAVRQFQEVIEDIRQQAIAQGTAIEGDWEGD